MWKAVAAIIGLAMLPGVARAEDIGRYQIVAPPCPNCTYHELMVTVIDTATGDLWEVTQQAATAQEKGYLGWRYMGKPVVGQHIGQVVTTKRSPP